MNEKISWTSGELIYTYDDLPDFAYLLIEGEVEIKSKSGKSIGFINKDEVFGEQSILLETKRTVSAVASRDSLALKIPKQKLQDEYNEASILIKAILRSTSIRLTNLGQMVKKDLESYRKN